MGRLCAFAFLLLFASPQVSVKENLRMLTPTVKGNMTLSEQCHLILKLLGEHNKLSDQFVQRTKSFRVVEKLLSDEFH